MLTLDEAKLHLRLDHDDTDFEIQQMIDGAVQHLASIGCDVATVPVAAPLKQAALMLVSHLHDSRGLVEAEGPKLSPVFFRLVAPYREIAL